MKGSSKGFLFYALCFLIFAPFKIYRLEKVILADKSAFITKALNWADTHSHFAYYNSNQIEYPYSGFMHCLAIGAKRVLHSSKSPFEALADFHQNTWLFGYLGYDLKNNIEKLESQNKDRLLFNDLSFFEPEHLLVFEGDEITIHSQNPSLIQEIEVFKPKLVKNELSKPTESVSKEEYIKTVEKLRNHIEEGDCYEINYCQEFHGQLDLVNPIELYTELNRISPNPFSCLQKHIEHYIISASPERFLKKAGSKLISQPIKGTRPRSSNPVEDQRLAKELRSDEKELAENMMIVDLVRNDLARSSAIGSVKVEEIFGIYSFQQVHQMISTIVSEKRGDVSLVECIKNAFPMGSMTGAPKVKVMQLIEQYENTKRGPFSGAAGYLTPDGGFDFNVLIRSLFLNAELKTYSFQVGSAITYDSIPEKEYEECMVKAKAILSLLKQYEA
jgi:para-aminobenzoate synthetase component 1